MLVAMLCQGRRNSGEFLAGFTTLHFVSLVKSLTNRNRIERLAKKKWQAISNSFSSFAKRSYFCLVAKNTWRILSRIFFEWVKRNEKKTCKKILKKFEKTLKKIFAVLDKITASSVSILRAKITPSFFISFLVRGKNFFLWMRFDLL